MGDADGGMLRQAPCAIDAEQAVLGGVMLVNESLAKVSDWLKSTDFFNVAHQRIYTAMLDMSACDPPRPMDAVSMADWLLERGHGESIDGGSYLTELATTTPSAANIVAYAEIVKSKSVQRQLIGVGRELMERGFSPQGEDVSVIVAGATQQLAELQGVRQGSVKAAKVVGKRWYEALTHRYNNGAELQGLATPWAKFNSITNGLKPGELVVVAARPAMGKSAWAVNVATSVAMRGQRALIFNLEMTDTAIYNRAVASLTDVPLSWLQKPTDDGENSHWPRVSAAVKSLNESGLLIDDSPGLSMAQIAARCRRERMKGKLGLVVIDHLHLIPLPGKTKESTEIGDISGACKRLAKEMDCPVVVLSQLNRGLEARTNKRPRMSDLRESGAIEQDADLIVFLYRDDYYAQQEGKVSQLTGFVEMIIAKQREGETGTVWARNALGFGRIDDFEGPAPHISIASESGRGGGLN
ncbi:hypothetical protein ARC78_07535 [Stenotrophomonas pictorum JCM 9942]|uniref:Replicative DNA helicase n=1 Tax=Stenotrophomonas pictorum JCM 9942 TaxID=1236960 RepID=A0A0R0AN56_9GAMM|nr:replicative DNA helicase [Stenotrophomonas pictorum]KRG43210.1 hypothetical protein ARC78_07535 [Stenotrophomonas pictorum JCM 9942]